MNQEQINQIALLLGIDERFTSEEVINLIAIGFNWHPIVNTEVKTPLLDESGNEVTNDDGVVFDIKYEDRPNPVSAFEHCLVTVRNLLEAGLKKGIERQEEVKKKVNTKERIDQIFGQ